MTYFTLPLPPSVNALYRNVPKVGRVKTRAAKDWYTQAAVMMAQQHVRQVSGRICVTYSVGRHPDKRKRDVANYEKALSDSLVANKVIEDDSLIESLRIHWTDLEPAGTVGVSIVSVGAGVGRAA